MLPDTPEPYIEQFKSILFHATEMIQWYYMKLPVAGKEKPDYRERVYCYELYHCIRVWMDREYYFPYVISGELDKRGNPFFYNNNLDKSKPDLVIHKSGDMGYNLAVVEVKPVNASANGITKDLKRLTAFRRQANYQYAVYLIYGDESDQDDLNDRLFNRIKATALKVSQKHSDEIDLRLIDLYWHYKCGYPAKKQEW